MIAELIVYNIRGEQRLCRQSIREARLGSYPQCVLRFNCYGRPKANTDMQWNVNQASLYGLISCLKTKLRSVSSVYLACVFLRPQSGVFLYAYKYIFLNLHLINLVPLLQGCINSMDPTLLTFFTRIVNLILTKLCMKQSWVKGI